jgi:membrane protease YdiL (CAAX protease family)
LTPGALAPERSGSGRTLGSRLIPRQRVPARAMDIRDPRGETRRLLAFAVGYIALSYVTGRAIRAYPMPIVEGAYFTKDLWYVLVFKIGALLLVPLLWMRARGYRVRDLSPGWRVTPRTVAVALAAFAAGALLNSQHFDAIGEAASRVGTAELVLRAGVGFLLPLFTAAIPEEIVYRGLLQTRLERTAGRVVGVLLTAVLFAAWHIPSRFVLANGVEGQAGDLGSVILGTGVPVFLVGLVFGILYDRHRQLVPLVAAHWGIDAIVGVAAFLEIPI